MGASASHTISLATAENRLGGVETARVRKCFVTVTSPNVGMSQSQFTSQVFGSPFAYVVARALFSLFDVHQKGELSEEDFVIGLAIFTRGTVDEKLHWLFSLYDLDRDGIVNRFDLKSMLAVDLILSAVPPLEIGKYIEQMVRESLPGEDQGFSFVDFCAWVRSHKELLSLGQWALTTDADGVGGSTSQQPGQDTATRPPIARPTDPLEYVLVALKNAAKGRLFPFLDSRGYEGPVSTGVNDDVALRNVVEWILSSDKQSSKRIAWAFLGRRPPSVEDEHDLIAWLVAQSERDTEARGKGKEDRLEDSVEMTIAPQSADDKELNVRYLVAANWFKAWREGGSKSAGPIDNSPLLNTGAFSVIKPGLVEGADYAVVLPQMWFTLCSWYGGGPALHRPFLKELSGMVEVYPLNLSVYIRKSAAPLQSSKFLCDEKLDIAVSRADTIAALKVGLCSRLGCRVFFARLWKICEDGHFALLSKEADSVVQSGLFEGANMCIELAFGDGTWPIDGDKRVATSGLSAAKTGETPTRVAGSLRIGLRNLGNTCYMNAALQSLLATPVFNKPYFSSGIYRKELCLDNPIGFGGRVAWAYGNMVEHILSATSDVFVPSEQKTQIGLCNPDFAGFRQHDSQELLTWLLDALHEDLNRVVTKPYLQDPDDDKNQTDAELAAVFWENHKTRNDSVIVDLFHGQIKSSVKCNECQTVSRKFDVFASLGLPLPAEDMRLIELLLHPLTSPAFPTRYGIRLPKSASIMDLKVKLFEISGIKPRTVALFSAWNSRHDRFFNNTDKLDAVRDQETLLGYFIERSNAKLLLCNPPPRVELMGPAPSTLDESDDEEGGCMGMLFGDKSKKKAKNKSDKKAPPDLNPTAAAVAAAEAKDKTEFDDEMESVVTAGGAKSSLMDCCYVQFVHRRIDAAHESALFCHFVPRLFGWPLLLSFRIADYNSEQL
jgi:Ca2+-binding EF-hand superfamily protein